MATRKSKTKDQLSLTPPPPTIPDVEQQPVAAFARKAYLDYSMYVILDRAAAQGCLFGRRDGLWRPSHEHRR